jgi:hypothetical protein
MERCLCTGLPEQKEENVSGYNGMKTYCRWIESVFATTTIPVTILLVEILGICKLTKQGRL